MKKKFFISMCSIFISLSITLASYAGTTFNMYVTDHDSDSDYYEYEIIYDTADSYNGFLNWMEENNEIVSEFTDPINSYSTYSFKAPGKLQEWNEIGEREIKDIQFDFNVYKSEKGYRVVTIFPEVFFIANKLENGNLESMNWKDNGNNSYNLK